MYWQDVVNLKPNKYKGLRCHCTCRKNDPINATLILYDKQVDVLSNPYSFQVCGFYFTHYICRKIKKAIAAHGSPNEAAICGRN